MIVLVGFLIANTAVIVYDRGITELTNREYEARSTDIAKAMAEIVDAQQVKTLRDAVLEIYNAQDEIVLSDQWGTAEFNEYISHYSGIEKTEEYLSLLEQLRQVQDVINVDCLYITWVDIPNDRYVYLVDAAHEDACPPGCVDPFFNMHSYDIDFENGSPPNVTHTKEYGYLVTTGMPIHTDDGEIVGLATVDISMNEIARQKQNLRIMAGIVFTITTAVACLIGIWAVRRAIIDPINKLSKTASNYNAKDLKFSDIDIHTGDEIETLANSIKQMEKDTKDYYENLIATKNDLKAAKENAEAYKREANIDSLTKLRNKRAYDFAVTDLDKSGEAYAIAMIDLNDLKGINDHYGHDKGDIAIKNLSKVICKIFKHSPVFRIGGDEFVIILTNEDLDAREGLIGHFRDEIRRVSKNANLQPWERISAACGHAVYDPKLDKDASSVFKRADEDMYEHKIKMKKA